MSEPVVASADWQQESNQFPQQILQSVGKKWVFGAQTWCSHSNCVSVLDGKSLTLERTIRLDRDDAGEPPNEKTIVWSIESWRGNRR